MLLASVLIVLGALVGRGISPRLAATAAVVISVLTAILTWWFYRANVQSPVAAGYGLYLGAGCVLALLGCSVWALVAVLLRP